MNQMKESKPYTPAWVRKFLGKEQEKPLMEQLKEQIDLAEEFDRLQSLPGWEKVAKFMASTINATLEQATHLEYEPEKQAICVNQWNAQRELLDRAIGYMQSAQRERDRIVEEYKEMQDARTGTGN